MIDAKVLETDHTPEGTGFCCNRCRLFATDVRDTLEAMKRVVDAAEMLFSELDISDAERAQRVQAFIRPLEDALAPFRAPTGKPCANCGYLYIEPICTKCRRPQPAAEEKKVLYNGQCEHHQPFGQPCTACGR